MRNGTYWTLQLTTKGDVMLTLIEASKERNGLIVTKTMNCINSLEIRKISLSGRERGIVATINKSGYVGRNGSSWREFKSWDINEIEVLIKQRFNEIERLF
jgi:hypothetical protein